MDTRLIKSLITAGALIMAVPVYLKFSGDSQAEPTTEREPIEGESTQKNRLEREPTSLAAFQKTVRLRDIPKELHAKSAILISAHENLLETLSSADGVFSFPLEERKSADYKVTKVIENGDLSIFMGQLADGERSHFKLVLQDGVLHSGTFHALDKNEQYILSTQQDKSLLLSLVDPEIDLPTCGCESCISSKHKKE